MDKITKKLSNQKYITRYHITNKDNIPSINANGLEVRSGGGMGITDDPDVQSKWKEWRDRCAEHYPTKSEATSKFIWLDGIVKDLGRCK